MSGRRPFSKLKGRNAPSAGSAISFRFSRVDEELEEIPLNKKFEQADESTTGCRVDYSGSKVIVPDETSAKDFGVKSHHTSGKEQREGNVIQKFRDVAVTHNETNGIAGKAEDAKECEKINDIGLDKCPDPKDQAVKDSVKDYLSRFGRRACSLDSDSKTEETESDTEVWPFLKDLKGRITKNLEERISKDMVTEGEIPEAVPYPESMTSSDSSQTVPVFSAVTAKVVKSAGSDREDDDHVSPSIEATETLEEHVILEKLVNSERKHSGSEQKSPSSEVKPVSQSPLSTGTKRSQLIKKKAADRPDLNMTLSSLMASRSFSFEDTKGETQSTEVIKADIPVSTTEAENVPVITSSAVDEDACNIPGTTPKETLQFWKLFFHIPLLSSFTDFSWNKIASFVILVTVVFSVLPLSAAIYGFLMGCILAGTITFLIMKPSEPRKPFKLPDYDTMPPLVIQKKDIASEIIYKGWMNELFGEYNPDTYHVNCTHSAYIRLDGSYLRISHPKTNIPKRAMFNEPRHELAFIYQRHYDITGASVMLLPEGLYRKRLWSKKYPISVTIPDAKQSLNTAMSSSKESSGSPPIPKVTPASKDSSPAKRFEPKPSESGEVVLYLFARTDREKYDWYHRFVKSSRLKMLKSYSPVSTPNISSLGSQFFENKRAFSVDLGSLQQSSSMGSIASLDDQELEEDDAFAEIKFDKQCKFDYYMTQLLSSVPSKNGQSRRVSSKDAGGNADSRSMKSPTHTQAAQTLSWLNALIGRLFFDFITEDVWAAMVAERIQKKLSKLKLPNFIEELKITDIHLGSALPKIHRASNPVMDDRGLWVDIDVSYNGSFQMTLETKLNLLKLQKSGEVSYPLSSESKTKEMDEIPAGSRTYDSEEEDSAESSSDDDVQLPEIAENASDDSGGSPVIAAVGGGSTGKKLIRLVDRIAQSSYFQTAAKNKYIKRAMEEVSNMPLVLTVEVHWLIGTLAINIPPMPTDRLWYGFRKNPQLSIVARPKLGCRQVKLAHVTEWIEKKLVLEFQKLLVMPNMDDLIIPIMKADMETSKT